MTDIVLTPVTTGYNISNINANFSKIQTVLNTDVLRLSGGDNVLLQDLDFNGFRALNLTIGDLQAPTMPNDAVRLQDLQAEASVRQSTDIGLQTQITNLQVNQTSGIIGYATLALLNADLSKADGVVAIVTNDPTTANNTTYRKSGPPGSGSWVVAVDRITLVQNNLTAYSNSLASSSGASQIGFLQVGTGAVARTLQSKAAEEFSVKDFGALGDGITSDVAKIQAAVDAVSAAGGGLLNVPQGTYILDTPITMKSNVYIKGINYPTFLMKAGANQNVMFEFSTTGNDATIEGCIIDGNRSTQTDGNNPALIHVRSTNRGTVKGCIIRNSAGYGVASNGTRTTFKDNVISNCYMHGIAIFNGNTQATDAFHIIEDNRLDTLCTGGMILGGSNYAKIRGNTFQASQIGGRGNRLTVNTSGTTVTRVSGPDFSNIRKGMFVVINNGQEYQVTAIPNNNTLTVNNGMPTLTSAAASVGTGDIMGIVNSSWCNISENTLYAGATFGIALSLGNASWQCSNNNISNNILSYSGKNAINCSYDSGTGFLSNNSLLGNKIFNAGNSAGTSTDDCCGIYVYSGTGGKNDNTFIDANTIISDAGDGQTPYWLGVDGGGSFGSVLVGRNANINTLNQGILNDVRTITLGSTWGNTSTTSAIVSNGHTVRFTITSAGTGQAPGPSVIVNKICRSPELPILAEAHMQTTTGTLSILWGEQTSSAGSWNFAYPSTPTAGSVYQVVIRT